MPTDMKVRLGPLELMNPLMAGSGPPGDSLAKLKKLEQAGVGCLVTKTISTTPAPKSRPVMAFEGELFFNTEKWSTKSLEEWRDQILPAMKDRKVPLLASVGYTGEQLEALVRELDGLVDGFEMSTHYVGSDASSVLSAVKRVRNITSRPLFVKLSAHSADIVASALAAEKGGANGITAINSVGPVLSVDADKGASRLGSESPYCWLSGPAIKPIALKAVYDITRAVEIPVIGCGGASTARDVIDFVLAGAHAVQMCTALIRNGPGHVQKVLEGLSEIMSEKNIERLSDLRGRLIPHYVGAREK